MEMLTLRNKVAPLTLILALSATACTSPKSAPEEAHTTQASPSGSGERIIAVCEIGPEGDNKFVNIKESQYDPNVYSKNLADCGPSSSLTSPVESNSNACDKPGLLEVVSVANQSETKDVELVNDGPCAFIYDADTYRTIGSIPTGQNFVAVCIGVKPNSIEVDYEGHKGNMHLSNDFTVKGLNYSENALLPNC